MYSLPSQAASCSNRSEPNHLLVVPSWRVTTIQLRGRQCQRGKVRQTGIHSTHGIPKHPSLTSSSLSFASLLRSSFDTPRWMRELRSASEMEIFFPWRIRLISSTDSTEASSCQMASKNAVQAVSKFDGDSREMRRRTDCAKKVFTGKLAG